MSIYQDTAELKKLFEQENIFKAATPEDIDKRSYTDLRSYLADLLAVANNDRNDTFRETILSLWRYAETHDREGIVKTLAQMWRSAENAYIEDDVNGRWWKDMVQGVQEMLALTDAEENDLEEICGSMGI